MKLQVCCPDCMARVASCETCSGTGLVCPTCRGLRWLAQHREGAASLRLRCHDCGLETTEGWEYDPYREMLAVDRWLTDWQNGVAVTTEATLRAQIERDRQANAANAKQPNRGWKHG